MTKVTIDAATIAKLGNLDAFLEFCDESGRTLGYFRPEVDPALYERIGPSVSEEELQRRERGTEWYTTAEVLAHLEKLS